MNCPPAFGLRAVAAAATLASAAGAAAQTSTSPAAEVALNYGVQAIDTRRGLSSNTTFAVLQDDQGFVWIGTIDGLNRFDGADFRIFRHGPDDPTSISNNSIRQLWDDPDGNIWMRTGVGTDRLDPATGEFHHYDFLGQDFVDDAQGRLLMAADEGLFRYVPGTDSFEAVSSLATSWRFAEDPVWRMLLDRNRNVWIGTAGGRLLRLDPNDEVAEFETPFAPASVGFEDPEGRLWVGHERGLGIFDPATGETFTPPEMATFTRHVLPMVATEEGEVWIGSDRLYRMVPGHPPRVARLDDGPAAAPLSSRFWDMMVDREGGLWIATVVGLRRLDPYAGPFVNFTHDPGDPASVGAGPVTALHADGDGDLWAGTLAGNVTQIGSDGQIGARFAVADSDCGQEIWSLEASDRDALWVGTSRGLCHVDRRSGTAARIRLVNGADPFTESVQAILPNGPNELWVGSLSGLFKFDTASHAVRRVPLPVPHGIQGMQRDADGGIWIGTLESDLLYLAEGAARPRLHAVGQADTFRGSEGFWTIRPSSSNQYWVGSDRGLFDFASDKESLTPAEVSAGVDTGPVYAIARDAAGSVWLSTNNGLLRLESAPDQVRARRYTVADGLPHFEFNRRAFARLPDGRLAFGGFGGVTVVDPGGANSNPFPPPVRVLAVERAAREGIVRQENPSDATVVVPHHDTGLTFRFAAMTLGDPTKTRYAYKLDGFDAAWHDVGPDRYARYPALPAGDYTLTVRAANGDGVWNEDGANVRLRVEPAWFATTWFRALVLLTSVLGLGLAVRHYSTRHLRLRVRQLELDREIRLERERISRDLHDNVGARVSTFLAGVELAQLTARSERADDLDGHLGALRGEAQRTMEQLHETVWSLNRERVSLGDLAEQVDEYLLEQGRFRERPKLRRDVVDDPTCSLRSERGLDMFRIIQEAVRNAIRHAAAAAVTVRLASRDGNITLQVEDDGTHRNPADRPQGNGVRGMAQRAERLGGDLLVERNAAGGTTVTLRAPM